MKTHKQNQTEDHCNVGQSNDAQRGERVSCTSVLSCSVPKPFIEAFGEFAKRDKEHDPESIRSAFKCQEAWSKLQKELIAWVEMEQNDPRDLRGKGQ